MSTLSITTDKTRAQMVTELNGWANATKVSGYDYVWAISDNINVSATIDISGFNLVFASTKRMQAQAGGTINVSTDFINRFNYPTRLTFTQASDTDTELVAGTGRWVGKGLSIAINGGNLRFNSDTSQTNLEDLSVDAIKSSVSALRVLLHNNGVINLYRVTGMTVIRYSGVLTMNPYGDGLVSSQNYGSPKLVAINSTFTGFVVSSDATHRTQTASSAYNATTMTFVDGKVNPEFLDAYPKDNDGVIRIIKRTLTLNPKDSVGANVTGFKYRVLSKRVVMPNTVVTDDYVVVSSSSANYGGHYLMTVWRGVRATGSSGYNPLRDITIDKELTVKVRKYGYKEGEFKANSYYYSETATPTLEIDIYTKVPAPILNHLNHAAQFYDAVRELVALDMAIPEDLFTTDGVIIAIKPTWTLKRSATATNIAIDKTSKSIILDKDSYIAKHKSGKWDYTGFTGTVDATMDGHTNMSFPRTDGNANLTVRVTCPFGVEDGVVGVWKHSQGVTNRAGIIASYKAGVGIIDIPLVVSPTEKYYAVAKAHGSNMTSPIIVEPIGVLGTTVNISVDRMDKATGHGLLPIALTAAQQRIADMFIFDSSTNDIDIKLPTDYSTDSRWDGTNRIWQFLADDFGTIAFKIDEIQTTTTFIATTQRAFFLDNKMELATDVHAGILKQSSQNTTIAGGAVKVSFNLFSISRFGDNFQKNTFIDNSNGAIDVVGGIPLAISVSAGLTPTEKAQLTAVKTEADKIPAIKTQTDKLTAVKTETDKIQSVKNETDKITSIETETDKIPAIKTKTDLIVAGSGGLTTAQSTQLRETHQRLALDSAKPLTNKPDGGFTSSGITVAGTSLADGSTVQTRT